MARIYYPKPADNWTLYNVCYLWRTGQQYNLTLTGSDFYPSIRLNNHHSSRLLRGCEIRDKNEEGVALAELHRINFFYLSARRDNVGGQAVLYCSSPKQIGKFRMITNPTDGYKI